VVPLTVVEAGEASDGGLKFDRQIGHPQNL
jgi:hypothetical protein